MDFSKEVSSSDIAAKAAQAAFGHRLITNVHRGLIAEAIVAEALGTCWEWCSADYAPWDFQRADGLKLEVKQAASRQSWHSATDRSSRISFDIRARKGRYDGSQWVAEHRRFAEVYVFAHHHVTTNEADHRDPAQWLFYVARESTLPDQKQLSLSRVISITQPCTFTDLKAVLAAFQPCSSLAHTAPTTRLS